MVLTGMFRAEFEQLETRVAMAEDVTAALVELIARVEQATKAMAPADWRNEVEDLRGILRSQLRTVSKADDVRPPLAKSPMQRRKRCFLEAAIIRLTALITTLSTQSTAPGNHRPSTD